MMYERIMAVLTSTLVVLVTLALSALLIGDSTYFHQSAIPSLILWIILLLALLKWSATVSEHS